MAKKKVRSDAVTVRTLRVRIKDKHAAWGLLRPQLQYKCDDAGVWYEDVNEAYSTVTCSCCKRRTGPKGL